MSLERALLAFYLRIQSLCRRGHVEAHLDEELLFHIEHLTESNIAKGMTPKEARYQALKAMQGYEQKKEECRDARGVNWLENIARDVRYGMRMLRRSPVFTAVAILSLALGIGANSAIFSVIDTLLLRPLPVPNPQQLRNLFLQMPERPQPFLSYPMFQALEGRNQTFTSLATWSNHRFQMISGDDVIHIDGQLASGSYFSTLNISPARGRIFTSADDHPSGGKNGPVAVISDRFWSRRYQRSPSAVGSGIVLDRIRFTVISIMPPNFLGAEVGTHPDVWIPISFASRVDSSGCIASRKCWWLIVTGRMKPGVTAEQVNAELRVIGGDVLQETIPPGWNAAWQKRYRSYTFSSDSGAQGWSFLRLQFTNPLLILMTLVALVLLIACANLANMLLARASARHREIAVRLSMGAGRARVIRQLLTESVLLSLAGGLAGTLFTFWLTRILIAFVSTERHGPAQFTRLELQPDWRIVLFTLGVAFISGLVFGLTPALRSTRMGIASSLKESAHNLRGREGRFQSGRLILTIQTALSVLLVAAAGLFAGSLFRLLTLNYGFNPDNVSLIEVDTDKRPEKGAPLTALYARILERANGLPGVKAASLSWFVPLSGGGWEETLHVPGKPDLPQRESATVINLIGPRFFDVLETRLLSGRQFNAGDTAAAEKVGILSELAAQRFFPRENPIGQHILLLGKPIRIIGLAENMKHLSLRGKDSLELYLPYTQKADELPSLSATFLIKTQPRAPSPNSSFRAMLHDLAPDVPIGMTYTMEQQVDSSVGRERLMASLSIFFGCLALLLTSIGLYGILAYTVTRRTGEIGIRMALGARRSNVIWLVLRGAVGYVLGGILIGAITVLAASRVVASLLYGVRPNDPGNLAAAIVALLFVTALAALLPSLRASRVDPAISLRQE
jgi:predicted permease